MAEKEQEEYTFGVDDWKKFWKDDMIGFHLTVVNPVLEEFYDKLAGNKSGLRWFLPLCGKTLDMKWLIGKGQEVVGLDCAEKAAVDFFTEQSLKYTVSDVAAVDGGKLYKSEDGLVKFYVCDFFSTTSDLLGQFDIIWDYGAYYAIPGMEQKARYATLLQSLIKPGGQILLDIMEPRNKEEALDMGFDVVSEDDVRKMFDKCTSCELVKVYDYKDISHLFYKSSGDDCSMDDYGKVYLLKFSDG